MARLSPGSVLGSSVATTATITLDSPSPSQPQPPQQQQQALVLRLSRPKKKVTWKKGTVDNEFLQRKSSKKCCIFHKQKPFDEDTSDDDEKDCHGHDHPTSKKCVPDDGVGTSNCCSSSGGH